jgi:hypothetical protein
LYSCPNIIRAILLRRMKCEKYWPPVGAEAKYIESFDEEI